MTYKKASSVLATSLGLGLAALFALAQFAAGETAAGEGKDPVKVVEKTVADPGTVKPESAQTSQQTSPGGQKPCKLDRSVRVALDYLLYLPAGYEQQKSWPLLLFLHGAGERGNDLELVKVHGPPKLIAAGKEFPFVVVSPQCPKGRWWQPHELTALLDEIVETYRIDQDRICVTGLSMGGFGTWAVAAYTPERFAALVPVCGGGEAYWTREFARVPVWAFHGAKDSVVPLERSEKMVEAIKKHGGSAKLTAYPEAGHDSWTETYNNPELYEWLLQQKRVQKKPEAPSGK
ncbi:MAG: prolyl oligopeptidase family serine peptidase [Pirellulales bacterium]|nr:prolyl oligopeptidase family serine peptidase [Pirellulales bacterium]